MSGPVVARYDMKNLDAAFIADILALQALSCVYSAGCGSTRTRPRTKRVVTILGNQWNKTQGARSGLVVEYGVMADRGIST